MTTTALNKKFEEIENKIPGIASFLTIPEMDRLKKISFDARMEKATESLESNSQVNDAVDIAHKHKEKLEKLQTFDLSYFTGKMYFKNDGSRNYVTFQPIYNNLS